MSVRVMIILFFLSDCEKTLGKLQGWSKVPPIAISVACVSIQYVNVNLVALFPVCEAHVSEFLPIVPFFSTVPELLRLMDKVGELLWTRNYSVVIDKIHDLLATQGALIDPMSFYVL